MQRSRARQRPSVPRVAACCVATSARHRSGLARFFVFTTMLTELAKPRRCCRVRSSLAPLASAGTSAPRSVSTRVFRSPRRRRAPAASGGEGSDRDGARDPSHRAVARCGQEPAAATAREAATSRSASASCWRSPPPGARRRRRGVSLAALGRVSASAAAEAIAASAIASRMATAIATRRRCAPLRTGLRAAQGAGTRGGTGDHQRAQRRRMQPALQAQLRLHGLIDCQAHEDRERTTTASERAPVGMPSSRRARPTVLAATSTGSSRRRSRRASSSTSAITAEPRRRARARSGEWCR